MPEERPAWRQAGRMEGWLLKRGQMGTAKRRYFVLDGKVLAYYGGDTAEERQQAPRGQLVLGPDARFAEATGRRGAYVRACARLDGFGMVEGGGGGVLGWVDVWG